VVAELPAPQRCSDGELIAALTAAGRLEAVFLKTHGTWHLTQGEFGELSCAPAGDTHTTTPPTPGEWDTHLDDLDTTAYLNQIVRDATPARAGPGRSFPVAVVPVSPRNDSEDPPPF
jgi:hypothetical protein